MLMVRFSHFREDREKISVRILKKKINHTQILIDTKKVFQIGYSFPTISLLTSHPPPSSPVDTQFHQHKTNLNCFYLKALDFNHFVSYLETMWRTSATWKYVSKWGFLDCFAFFFRVSAHV